MKDNMFISLVVLGQELSLHMQALVIARSSSTLDMEPHQAVPGQGATDMQAIKSR